MGSPFPLYVVPVMGFPRCFEEHESKENKLTLSFLRDNLSWKLGSFFASPLFSPLSPGNLGMFFRADFLNDGGLASLTTNT